MSTPKPYEVYAIKYAENLNYRSIDAFLGGDPHNATIAMDYFVWLIVGNGRRFLVDMGFRKEVAAKRKRDFLRCPGDAMRQLGVEPDSVEDVIITHLHYDHAGNFELFPEARMHLQDREMQFATGRHMLNPAMGHAYELDDVLHMVRRVFGRKAMFHDGDVEIAPGIWLHLIGGHTHGQQAVRVWTERGWVVLASDASHYYMNVQKNRPFTWSLNIGEAVDGFRKLRTLAPTPDHIIPGHDPLVMQRYAAPGRELEGIAVRLDVPPVNAK